MSRSQRNPERILQRLEWKVIRRLDGLLQGDYRTLFHGSGLDLADIREYQFGDDVRYIDWNVTARLSEPYVRQYNEDREITAWFILDMSPSVDFGSGEVKKRKLLNEFTTVLARLLTRHGNRVGAVIYGGKVEQVVPARGGRQHVLYLLDVLLSRPELPRSPPTDLKNLLAAAFNVMKRRSLVFIVSDFFSTPGWTEPLSYLVQRHEAVAVRLFDPLEQELPDAGILTMEDAETGEQLHVDTHDRGFRNRFAAAAQRREDELRSAFSQAGVDALELSTDDDIVDSIVRFASMRRQRDASAGGGSPAAVSGKPAWRRL